MADLESLLNDLANLDAAHDLEGMRRLREQIVADFPESTAAGEALYKLGLDHLFRQRNLPSAMENFTAAAQRKLPFWSDAARTSLGLCYYHQRRLQKALFELRKVAYSDPPTSHSLTALSFIENIFQTEGQKDEIKRVRKERIAQLQRLVADTTAHKPAECGYYLYSLGLALKDDGQESLGRGALEKAKNLGEQVLGADLYRAVLDLL